MNNTATQQMCSTAFKVGFTEELACLGGMEKTADWEDAIKGLILGGLIGGGAGLATTEIISRLASKNKNLAAMLGAVMGASLGSMMGFHKAGPALPPPPPATDVRSHSPYANVQGLSYGDVV